jgi:hypothetical protein
MLKHNNVQLWHRLYFLQAWWVNYVSGNRMDLGMYALLAADYTLNILNILRGVLISGVSPKSNV